MLRAAYVRRPHRFAVEAKLRDGGRIVAHLGDPGRLSELLIPGAELRLRPASPESRRRTRFSVVTVRAQPGRAWVSLEPARANDLAEDLLRTGAVSGTAGFRVVRREVAHRNSRLDFLLEGPRGRLWVEVKAVTLVDERGGGRFPDAPTVRGRRHVEHLRDLARAGDRAMVLFLALRGDVRSVRPDRRIDPAFAAALDEARDAGATVRAAGYRIRPSGRADYFGPLRFRP